MSRYLVTGGAGFIGHHIVRALVDAGEDVTVLDDFSSGRRENLAGLETRLRLIEGDLGRIEDCRRAVEGAAYVLHLGAIPSVPRSVAEPLLTNRANIDGTLNLLEAARAAGIERLVFSSSSSVYGDRSPMPLAEDAPPGPLSPYAAQKLAGEHYARLYHQLFGVPTVSLRYFNVFGPRQDPDSPYSAVIPIFITRMLRGARPVIFGDGLQARDFTFVDNVVAANLAAGRGERAVGQVINVALGQAITLLDLVREINRILGTRIEPEFAPPRPGDIRNSCADVARQREWLDLPRLTSFAEGLERTVAHYRAGRPGDIDPNPRPGAR